MRRPRNLALAGVWPAVPSAGAWPGAGGATLAHGGSPGFTWRAWHAAPYAGAIAGRLGRARARRARGITAASFEFANLSESLRAEIFSQPTSALLLALPFLLKQVQCV